MTGTTFIYAEESSEQYGLYICNFDGFNPTTTGGSEFSNNQVQIIGTDEFVMVNNSYSSAISYTFQVAKFEMCTLSPITANEYSQINRWLNRKEFHKFKVDTESYENIYWNGRFNCNPIYIGDVMYGIELTFISDHPYGFEDEIKNIYSGKTFSIYNSSDEIGTIYPKVKISCKENGKLEIRNDMDNEITIIENCTSGEVLTIDSKHKTIVSSNANHKIYDDFNWNYPKLCNDYNNRINHYSSTLDIDFELIYAPARKVGVI